MKTSWKPNARAWLVAASAVALLPAAVAQTVQPAPPAEPAGHLCVDARDAGARPTRQPQACQLPSVPWPLPTDPATAEPRRWGSFQREGPAIDGAPEVFWRLPWRGYPPHSAPSAFFWR
jgi:hypothetical protein